MISAVLCPRQLTPSRAHDSELVRYASIVPGCVMLRGRIKHAGFSADPVRTAEEANVTASMTHPQYLWWNGKRVNWEDATVHVTALHWTAVNAIFEGIMSYWNADEEELYVFRLDAH